MACCCVNDVYLLTKVKSGSLLNARQEPHPLSAIGKPLVFQRLDSLSTYIFNDLQFFLNSYIRLIGHGVCVVRFICLDVLLLGRGDSYLEISIFNLANSSATA